MRRISNRGMLSVLIILLTFLIVLLALLYKLNIIFIKYVEHGILVSVSEQYANFKYSIYIDGELHQFESKDKSMNIAEGVINFKYRGNRIVEFISYAQPIGEKLMSKQISSIELEYSGNMQLSKKANAYILSSGTIYKKDFNSVVVGAKNIKFYKEKSGSIKTAIIEGDIELDSVRVGIKNQGFQSLDHDNLEFISDGAIKIEDRKDDRFIAAPPKTRISISSSDNAISITINEDTYLFKNRIYLLPEDPKSLIKILSLKRAYGYPIYRGTFEITKTAEKLNVINEVELEKYLYQVVPSEMPPSFGFEALKAQAVAARTYAISDLLSGAYAKVGFHVDDSTMSQVYNNYEENPLTTKAVDETRGIVMKYGDELIDAKYYSTSHGYGANANEIWASDGKFPGEKIPYLTVESYLLSDENYNLSLEGDASRFFKNWTLKSYDSDSPYFRWKVTFTKDELRNTIEKNLPLVYKEQQNYILTLQKNQFVSREIPDNCLGDLIDLNVAKRGEGGNIMELILTGSKGTYKIIKELNVRYVLRPRKSDTGLDKDIFISRIKSGDLKNPSLLPSAFMVFDINRDLTKGIKDITFYGGGYGHSVGLSQYGAKYLSSQGYSFDRILKIYYTNISIEKQY